MKFFEGIKTPITKSFLIVAALSSGLFHTSCFIKRLINVNQGDKYYVKGDYYKARNYYEKAVQIDTTHYQSNLKMGLLLTEELNQIDEAYPYLSRALRYKKRIDTVPDLVKAIGDYCFYASGYKIAGKYYHQIRGLIVDNELKSDVNTRISNINFALSNPDKHKKPIASIINLGPNVNTYFAEYNSVNDNDEKKLYYTARRPENTGFACDTWDGKYYEDMYAANHIEKFDFTKPENFTNYASEVKNIKNTKKHEAIVSISDNDSILFTYKNNAIYISKFKNGAWEEPQKMNKKVNKGSYQNHISISPDNKTIFYSSNKRGGFGGQDLYMIKLKSDSTWSDPINLGDKINTYRDEEGVEVLSDNKTIVFASKGLPGYGGYDLYYTERVGEDDFKEPVNFGPQINSPSDDTYLKLDSTMTEGFVSSGRRGGYGDMDIYRFYFLNKPNFNKCIYSKDSLLDKKFESLIAKSDLLVNDTLNINLSSIDKIFNHTTLYYFWKYDNDILSYDSAIVNVVPLSKGVHELNIQLTAFCDTCYERLNYCFKKKINALEVLPNDSLQPNIKTPYNVLSLRPVYFNFDKSYLRKDAIDTLNIDIKTLLENQNVFVKISAHCDSRGSINYNIGLSKRRAYSVVKYLVRKGVKADRIVSVIPLGESQLINNCGDGVKCPESEHQKNRRVDIIVAEPIKN